MSNLLQVAAGQYSDKGDKAVNQDYSAVFVPKTPLLQSKGIVVALADGISSSNVSQKASEIAVSSFIEDYYSTTEAWSVRHSVQCVLSAINSWLFFHTRRSEYRYNLDKGYVCTFSGIIIKSSTAHIFHVGDCRIYQLDGDAMQSLTTEHRIYVSKSEHYLQRAMGMSQFLDFDYQRVSLTVGSTFFLMSDGVYEFLSIREMVESYRRHADNLNLAAETIATLARSNGSDDNLTVQIVRVEELPDLAANELYSAHEHFPFPPALEARSELDGFIILRQLHQSARSHVYLAVDKNSQQRIVLKVPSQAMQGNKEHLERFLLEEWIARRINSAHVIKPCNLTRSKNFFYIATEYIEGQTLAQWMIDHPSPGLEQVREIIEQIALGLAAFHRLEMLHQDLRPENIMIDFSGTAKIIDFGSTWVAGLEETSSSVSRNDILGTAQYTAPEYFIGEHGTSRSDQFSLAVITYQMLSGRLPYGTQVAKARSRSAQRRLTYRSVLDEDSEIPAWVDFALSKALNPDPSKRYLVISEFLYDLRHPNTTFLNQAKAPLIERNPVIFWQSVSLLLALVIIALLYFVSLQ